MGNRVANKCQGCTKNQKFNPKTKSCDKIVVPKCPHKTVRNKKTGKCDCPKGTQRNTKTKSCEKIVHEAKCPKGYKKIGPNKCLKVIVEYTTKCPKGYKKKGDICYRHTTKYIYEDPKPKKDEDLLHCVL